MAPVVAAVVKKGGYNNLMSFYWLLLCCYWLPLCCYGSTQCDLWAGGITVMKLAELQPPMFDHFV